MEWNLKYKTSDVEKMIDVFSKIADKKDKPSELVDEIMKLIDYPPYILQEFLNCMDVLAENDKGEDYLKENYWGLIGYIVIRLNLATEDSVKFPEDM
jgi:hypothetical protein